MQEAVRALKRRVADLEQQLAQQQAAAEAAALQAQAGTASEAGRAARAAAALQQCEQQLAEARQQCEEYSRRLAAVEGQLQKAEFAKAQWEWRAQVRLAADSLLHAKLECCGFGTGAVCSLLTFRGRSSRTQPAVSCCVALLQDAEQRAAAASEAIEEANATAARLVGRRQAHAEGRAADVGAQAKAASLRALVSGSETQWLTLLLHGAECTALCIEYVEASQLAAPCLQQLEKQLAAARQELDALRQQHAQAAPPQRQSAAREQALQRQLQALRGQLAAVQQRQATTEQQLKGKAAELAAAEKRLRQFEAAIQRLAAKQAGGSSSSSEDFLIGAQHA